MKYEVGERVKILKRGQTPPIFRDNPDELVGKIGIIQDAQEENGYWVVGIGEKDEFDWFDEDAIELVNE